MKLADNEIRDITKYLEAGKPLPDFYRFLLDDGTTEEAWTGDYVFENEWQSFRTKGDRTLELKSVFHECPKGRRKIAVKVVDIFGNDTMKVIEVNNI